MKKIVKLIQSNYVTLILWTLIICRLSTFYSDQLFRDTAIQIKAGQWIIENKQLISGDIFSWHEGLSWIPHEQLWYILVGAIYSLAGIFGIALFASILSTVNVSICFREAYRSDKVNLVAIIIGGILATVSSNLPNTAIRPQIGSFLILTMLIISLTSEKDKEHKKLYWIFPLVTWGTALVHGGTIKLPFIVLALYIVIEGILEPKNLKTPKWYIQWAVVLGLGFVGSILTPNLLDTWTYQGNQEMYPEVMQEIHEWKPISYDIQCIAYVLIGVIGISLDNRMRDLKNNKSFTFKVATMLMFLIAASLYRRMILYFGIMAFMLFPKAVENIYELIIKTLDINTEKLKSKLVNLGIAITMVVNIVLVSLLSISVMGKAIDTEHNTLQTVAETYSKDINMVNFIKDKGYKKIYNDFDEGAWLLFNDIKVHVDNRVDPYLKVYSGEDHMHVEHMITDTIVAKEFLDKYHPDAMIFAVPVYSNETASGEVYKYMTRQEIFLEEVRRYLPELKEVYNNTVGEYQYVVYETPYTGE